MTSRIHGLLLPLVFPAGVAPGEGGDYNILTIARNGKGEPVLRGTALACSAPSVETAPAAACG